MDEGRDGAVILEKFPMDWKMRGRDKELQFHLLGC